MCWVPKNPPPLDFCGCPPCPICFNWVEPIASTIPRECIIESNIETASILIDGLAKFAQDMTGEWGVTVELERAAETVHERNLAPKKDAFTEMDEAKRMRMWLDAKRKERKPTVKVTKLKRTLDQMDLPTEVEKAPEPAADPVNQPVMSAYASVRDYNPEMRVYQSSVTGKNYLDPKRMEREDQEARVLEAINRAVKREMERSYFEQYRDPYGRRFR